MIMRKIDSITLFTDSTGNKITTPVIKYGSGAPHVVMVALQHGWEIIGLDTAFKVLSGVSFSGRVTLICAASPLAFADKQRMTASSLSSTSNQISNMNRVHPGNKNGNITEKSAWAIDQYIQKLNPDFVLDLHSYASQSIPHCILDECQPKLKTKLVNVLNKSQTVWYKDFDDIKIADQSLDKALSAIWVKRDVPSITIELGPLSLFSTFQSKKACQTLVNVLSAIGVIKDPIIPQKLPIFSEKTWRRSEIIYSGNEGGYLRPVLNILNNVKKGTILAEVVHLNGAVVDVIKAPNAGILFIWEDEYRVMSGSTLGIMLVPEKG